MKLKRKTWLNERISAHTDDIRRLYGTLDVVRKAVVFEKTQAELERHTYASKLSELENRIELLELKLTGGIQ